MTTKILILAAGYGTRLGRDVQEYLSRPSGSTGDDTLSLVQSLRGLPKPLLPLASKPLISHWLDQVLADNIASPEDVFLVTNQHYYSQFVQWARENQIPEENILNNGTTSNESRKGAIMDMKLLLDYMQQLGQYDQQEDGLIILGGDTLFDARFHLSNVAREMSNWDLLVLSYQLSDTERVTEKGIIELEGENSQATRRITRFLEKPAENETSSRMASPCFYALPRMGNQLLSTYLSHIDNQQSTTQREKLKQRDAPGHFVKYMVENAKVGALPIQRRFDVGRLDQFFEANQYFTQQRNTQQGQ